MSMVCYYGMVCSGIVWYFFMSVQYGVICNVYSIIGMVW